MNAMKTSLRRTVLAAVLAAVSLSSASAGEPGEQPGEGSKQADFGAVAGLTVGALIAGPPGAVVGAGIGAVIGDRYHRQAKAKAALATDLERSEAERTRLTANVAELGGSLATEQARTATLDQTLQRTDQLGVDVNFRTNDDAVNAQDMSPLLKLGAMVAAIPQAQVSVAGYADPRGSDALNDALSLRRAESVAAVLTSAGVPRERIVIEAHGKSESSSAQGDLDGYALERRVTVRMALPGSGEVASRD
jgi:outer membrane protein OmpA-like peptidoglycan-associated protein